MLKICDLCKGARKTMGLGLIEKTCTKCNGVGRVDIEKITDEEIQKHIEVCADVKANDVKAGEIKRRGRPKRINT